MLADGQALMAPAGFCHYDTVCAIVEVLSEEQKTLAGFGSYRNGSRNPLSAVIPLHRQVSSVFIRPQRAAREVQSGQRQSAVIDAPVTHLTRLSSGGLRSTGDNARESE